MLGTNQTQLPIYHDHNATISIKQSLKMSTFSLRAYCCGALVGVNLQIKKLEAEW